MSVPSVMAIILCLLVRGADSHLPDEPGGAQLLAGGLLEPGHSIAAVGLHVIDHLLEGLLLIVTKLPMVLDDDLFCQHRVLHLAADLSLQLEVHVLGFKVVCIHSVVDGHVGT